MSAVLSSVQLFATPWTEARQAPLSMEFSSQEYWSEMPFSTPWDLPDSGIKPIPDSGIKLETLALTGRFITTAPPAKCNSVFFRISFLMFCNMDKSLSYGSFLLKNFTLCSFLSSHFSIIASGNPTSLLTLAQKLHKQNFQFHCLQVLCFTEHQNTKNVAQYLPFYNRDHLFSIFQ